VKDQDQAPAVCHLTTLHRATDNRIFGKQAVSLARAGYRVTVVGRHDREEVRDGVRIVPLSTPRRSWLRRFGSAFRLLRLALRQRADAYQIHDPDLVPVGLLLRLCGKKVIYDAHEDYRRNLLIRGDLPRLLLRPMADLWWVFERVVARCFSWVFVADTCIGVYSASSRRTLITNVPPRSFLDIKPCDRQGENLQLLFLGMISEQRGIREIIAALDLLRNGRVELHVVGATEDPELLRTFEDHPKITYHGWKSWQEVRARLAEADVGLLIFQPNVALLGVSGQGNTKLFEYMAAGIPVLISDFPKLREFLDPIGACLAVDPTDPKKIAEAIDYLHENPGQRRAMGQNGRRAVREQYHWEREEKKLLAVYEGLLAGRRRHAPRTVPTPQADPPATNDRPVEHLAER